MPNCLWMQSAAMTYDFTKDWPFVNGTPVIESTVVKYGPRSTKYPAAGGSIFTTIKNVAQFSLIGRYVWWQRFTAAPTAIAAVLLLADSGLGTDVLTVRVDTARKLVVSRNSAGGTKTGSFVLAVDTWYRIALAVNIVSTSNWNARVYLSSVDGSKYGDGNTTLEISASNADFSLDSVTLGSFSSGVISPVTFTTYVNGIYIDDGSDLTDPGDIRKTAKLPAASNTNNFDSAVGSATNRWDYVSERALSESKGWQHAAATDVQENYGVQAAAAGDVNIAGKTVLARMAWIWAKRGAGTACTLRAAIASSSTNPTTTFAVTIPASTATGDSLFVLVTSRDHTAGTAMPTCVDTDAGGNTWISIGNSTDRVLSLWWKRATSATASKVITVAGCVGSCAGGVSVYQNAATSVTPYTNIVIEDNASGNETHAGFVPDIAGSAIGFGVSNYNNDNAVTTVSGATAGAFTNDYEKLSTGGSDCGANMSHINGTDAAAVNTGAITWAQTDGVTHSVSFAVRPELPAGPGAAKIMDNGTETSITLTTTSALYTVLTTAPTYPSNVAAIGMRSTNTSADTFLYECGQLVAYDQGTFNPAIGQNTIKPQAVNRAATY